MVQAGRQAASRPPDQGLGSLSGRHPLLGRWRQRPRLQFCGRSGAVRGRWTCFGSRRPLQVTSWVDAAVAWAARRLQATGEVPLPQENAEQVRPPMRDLINQSSFPIGRMAAVPCSPSLHHRRPFSPFSPFILALLSLPTATPPPHCSFCCSARPLPLFPPQPAPHVARAKPLRLLASLLPPPAQKFLRPPAILPPSRRPRPGRSSLLASVLGALLRGVPRTTASRAP
jgi:hypothetical protein